MGEDSSSNMASVLVDYSKDTKLSTKLNSSSQIGMNCTDDKRSLHDCTSIPSHPTGGTTTDRRKGGNENWGFNVNKGRRLLCCYVLLRRFFLITTSVMRAVTHYSHYSRAFIKVIATKRNWEREWKEMLIKWRSIRVWGVASVKKKNKLENVKSKKVGWVQ